MEEYKQMQLQLFLDRVHLSLEAFAEFVKGTEPRLRECYADTIHLTSNEFVKMMMVDSAFVYGMLVEASCGRGGSCTIFNRPTMAMNVMVDLMLLENQIPLFILEYLFKLDNEDRSAQQPTSRITEPARKTSFMDLVCKFVRLAIGVCSFDIDKVSSSGVVHLLDWLRRCHLSHVQLKDSPPPETKTKLGFLVSKPGPRSIFCKLPEQFGHLIQGCLWRCCRQCSQSVPPWEEGGSSIFGFDSLPTITKLHQSGVRFVPESTHLLNIKFDCQQETLKIPHIFMDDKTESIFRNLLAFEQCHYAYDLWISDYFDLLAQLISQPSDVDLLVQSGVLFNSLGDSNQAASIINNMAQGLMPCGESYFSDLCLALTEHYKRKAPWRTWHEWIATLRQDYFNNPWRTISVIAAAILLALTAIQTVYTVTSK